MTPTTLSTTIERNPLAPETTSTPELGALRLYVRSRAEFLGIDTEILDPVITMWEELYLFDTVSGRESIQPIGIGLAVADVMNEELGDTTYPGEILVDILLHDVGKRFVGKELVNKSNLGESWDYEVDMPKMEPHVLYGAIIVMMSDLPIEYRVSAAKVVSETHSKQKRGPYSYIKKLHNLYPELLDDHSESGDPTKLSFRERRRRDCVAIADFVDAMLTRENTRNKGMVSEECWQAIREHIEFMFDDYHNGWELAQKVYARVWSSYPQNAAQLTNHLIGEVALSV